MEYLVRGDKKMGVVKLGIEHNWGESWKNGEMVKYALSLDEILEEFCQNCHDVYIDVEINIDFCRRSAKNEVMDVCKACGKQIIADKLNDPNFIGNIKITIL